MPPLTLALLASVLQMQGGDATITSDNKGIDDLLLNVREQLENQLDHSNAAGVILIKDYTKTIHVKGIYTRGDYIKSDPRRT
jgi:hypothetical protein